MKIKLDDGAILPTRAHETDAGLDIYSPVRRVIHPRTREVIDTGVHIELPHGTVGFLKSKSGLMCKHGLVSEGVVDEGYTGSIAVCMFNHTDEMYIVEKGDKISQLVVQPCMYVTVEPVDEISGGTRASSGFGSTGR